MIGLRSMFRYIQTSSPSLQMLIWLRLSTTHILSCSSSSGKAHPADGVAKVWLRRSNEISQGPSSSKIIFPRRLRHATRSPFSFFYVIWMNTPTRPLEASGTSGGRMNGCQPVRTDGWWVEGYRGRRLGTSSRKRTLRKPGLSDQPTPQLSMVC